MEISHFLSGIKEQRLICGAAAISTVHWIITFFTDKLVFNGIPGEQPSDYIICKIAVWLLLFLFYHTAATLIFSRNRKQLASYQTIKYALLYFIPLIAVLAFKLPEGFLSNDESLIYESAVNLEHYTWFYYLTVYYYVISMMLIPFWMGPILIKVLLQLLVCGYCIYRLSKYMQFKYGKFLYLSFLIPPVLAYTTSAHRLPVYFLLYVLLCFTLLMDILEKKDASRSRCLFLLFLGTLLTQWRTEGIYLAGLLPILMLLAYRNLRSKKAALTMIAAFFLMQYLISVPQNGFFPTRLDDAADNRMGPFYAYTITNMYRNGLDLEKNADDLAIVDKFLSIDKIREINEYYEDINYEDVLILYKEGFVGTRPEADGETYQNYTDACKRIFLHNPDVLLKTRIGSFCYAALPYSIVYGGMSPRALVSLAVSIVKTLSYNLFIPHLIVLALWIFCLIKKRWYSFFLMSGLLCHWFIVFVLAPASYFKYYFPVYIMGYLYAVLLGIQFIYNRSHQDSPVRFLI